MKSLTLPLVAVAIVVTALSCSTRPKSSYTHNFEKFDTDQSKLLCGSELDDYFVSIFSKLDDDHAGYLEEKDLTDFSNHSQIEIEKKKISIIDFMKYKEKWRSQLDHNQDGCLTVEELKEFERGVL